MGRTIIEWRGIQKVKNHEIIWSDLENDSRGQICRRCDKQIDPFNLNVKIGDCRGR